MLFRSGASGKNQQNGGIYNNVTLPIGTGVSGSAGPLSTGNSTSGSGSSGSGVTTAVPTYAASTMVPSASVPGYGSGSGSSSASATTSGKTPVSTGAAVKREMMSAGSLLAIGAAVAALL